jgi:hypothetical protein
MPNLQLPDKVRHSIGCTLTKCFLLIQHIVEVSNRRMIVVKGFGEG